MEESQSSDGHTEYERMETLKQIRTANSVAITPELFEKLYLSPPEKVKGEPFGNPTPIAVVGFVMCLTPLSCNLMGWRGANGDGAAHIPVFFFMGGLLLTMSAIMEWIMGNSFAFVVFATFGSFWLSFGGTLHPAFAAFSSYAPVDATSPTAGMHSPGFNASLGFWLLSLAILFAIFLVCSLRTNVVFVGVFGTIEIAVFLLVASYWLTAEDAADNAEMAKKLTVGAGACCFACSLCGWYLLASMLLEIVDFPISLPVGDLSQVIKGKSDRVRKR